MNVLKLWYHLKAWIQKILYKVLFGKRLQIGKGTTWRSGFHIAIEEKGTIQIGRHCFFNHGCSVNAVQSVVIGDGTIFGENVHIYDHNHRVQNEEILIKKQGYKKHETSIGKHCWIGTNAVVLKGVTIGDGCIIGAGVVVREDVPEGTVLS